MSDFVEAGLIDDGGISATAKLSTLMVPMYYPNGYRTNTVPYSEPDSQVLKLEPMTLQIGDITKHTTLM